jgi:hypothetical protein
MLRLLFVLIAFLLAFKIANAQEKSCPGRITIAPYLGLDSKALVLISLYNQDIVLLQQRQKISKYKSDIGTDCPHTLFELSGAGTGLIKIKDPGAARIEATLDSAELDFASQVNDTITTFFDMLYNDQPVSSIGRVANSKVSLDRLFITFGNLNRSLIYLTLGRRYVPFGQYYSYAISGSIGQTLGKTEATSILAGYQHPGSKGIYGAIYTFKSVRKLLWDSNQKIISGFTTGYSSTGDLSDFDIGLDYIQSMTGAQGFQPLGLTNINIPGVDIHGKFDFRAISLIAEYTTAIKTTHQITFNNRAARPASAYYELGYELKTFNKSSSIGLGYGKTYQAVQFNLPSETINVTYNLSLSKYVILSAQYQHNVNYSLSQGNNYSPSPRNMIIFRLLAYF